jgi:serine/threonine protein kinase
VVQGDNQTVRASTLLEGLELEGGWRVTQLLERAPGATGSHFSTPYIVKRHDGPERGFLKALDFTVALDMPMPIADALQLLTNAYVFERNLVLKCAAAGMSNVIKGVGAGQIRIEHTDVNPLLAEVPYIILEEADSDIRAHVNTHLGALDEAWAYRVCHGAANGIRQLHQADVAHQDLKPSNVMVRGSTGMIGDLGRAWLKDGSGVFDGGDFFAGDITYAPPECLYRAAFGDHWDRMLCNDMYQVGSLLVFFCTGSGLTALIHRRLPPVFHWAQWPNDYENVLPYVRNAFDRVIDEIERDLRTERIADVISLIRKLCDPDPRQRGWHRFERPSQQFSMERCVSGFDRLARSAEIDFQRSTLR